MAMATGYVRTRRLGALLAVVALAGCAGTSSATDPPSGASSASVASSSSTGSTASTAADTASSTGTPSTGTPATVTPPADAAAPAATGSPTSGSTSTSVTAAGVTQLPRGGTKLFPTYRLFGYSGAPGSAAFGRLGTGNLDARVREIQQRGKAYAGGRKIMPVLELITVIVDDVPGADGDYNRVVSDGTIRTYLAAARRHKALLLLDIQPGRDDFLVLAKQLEPWLKQPDVGLALDPEWAVEKGQTPGRVYGRTTGAELDSVAAYLDGLVRTHRLPQKVMVFHQVAARVVRNQERVRARPGVVVIKSVDGIGSREAKTDTWRVLVRKLPPSIHAASSCSTWRTAGTGR
jgi:hypothetical protein